MTEKKTKTTKAKTTRAKASEKVKGPSKAKAKAGVVDAGPRPVIPWTPQPVAAYLSTAEIEERKSAFLGVPVVRNQEVRETRGLIEVLDAKNSLMETDRRPAANSSAYDAVSVYHAYPTDGPDPLWAPEPAEECKTTDQQIADIPRSEYNVVYMIDQRRGGEIMSADLTAVAAVCDALAKAPPVDQVPYMLGIIEAFEPWIAVRNAGLPPEKQIVPLVLVYVPAPLTLASYIPQIRSNAPLSVATALDYEMPQGEALRQLQTDWGTGPVTLDRVASRFPCCHHILAYRFGMRKDGTLGGAYPPFIRQLYAGRYMENSPGALRAAWRADVHMDSLWTPKLADGEDPTRAIIHSGWLPDSTLPFIVIDDGRRQADEDRAPHDLYRAADYSLRIAEGHMVRPSDLLAEATPMAALSFWAGLYDACLYYCEELGGVDEFRAATAESMPADGAMVFQDHEEEHRAFEALRAVLFDGTTNVGCSGVPLLQLYWYEVAQAMRILRPGDRTKL